MHNGGNHKNTPGESGSPPERELTPLELIRKGYELGQGGGGSKGDIKEENKLSAIPLKVDNGKHTDPMELLRQGYAERVQEV